MVRPLVRGSEGQHTAAAEGPATDLGQGRFPVLATDRAGDVHLFAELPTRRGAALAWWRLDHASRR